MITVADFIGKYEIAQAYDSTSDALEDYIAESERVLLMRLFGQELLDMIEANPTDPKYLLILNPFTTQLENGTIINSIGVKNMLLSIICAEYRREQIFTQTSGGNTMLKSEGADRPDGFNDGNLVLYNDGVKTFKNIQKYIESKRDDYPEYKGQKLFYASLF